MTFKRLTWDQYGLALAQVASSRAACTRRQVGAVVMSYTHRVLSMGYNGTAPQELNCTEGGCPRGQLTYDECPALSDYRNSQCVHAEVNATDYADYLAGSTLYVSCEPCYECREHIAGTSISRVVWPEGEYLNVHGE